MKVASFLTLTTSFFSVFLLFSCRQEPLSSTKNEKNIQEQARNENFEATTTPKKSETVTIKEHGSVEAFNEVDVFFNIDGKIDGVQSNYRVGETFQAGDLLFQLNNAQLFGQLKSGKIALLGLLNEYEQAFGTSFPSELIIYQQWKNSIKPLHLLAVMPFFSANAIGWLKKVEIHQAYIALERLEAEMENYFYLAPFSGYFTSDFSANQQTIKAKKSFVKISKANQFCVRLSIPSDVFNQMEHVQTISLNFPTGQSMGKIIASKKVKNSVELTVSSDVKLSKAQLKQVVPVNITYESTAI